MATTSKARKKVAKKKVARRQPKALPRLSESQVRALIEEATVDASGDDEQRMSFETLLEDNLALPFETKVLGIPVVVDRISLTPDLEIVAICRSGRYKQAIPLLELPLPRPRPSGWEWVEAYRHWACRW